MPTIEVAFLPGDRAAAPALERRVGTVKGIMVHPDANAIVYLLELDEGPPPRIFWLPAGDLEPIRLQGKEVTP